MGGAAARLSAAPFAAGGRAAMLETTGSRSKLAPVTRMSNPPPGLAAAEPLRLLAAVVEPFEFEGLDGEW